jgi:hypothetical protein
VSPGTYASVSLVGIPDGPGGTGRRGEDDPMFNRMGRKDRRTIEGDGESISRRGPSIVVSEHP